MQRANLVAVLEADGDIKVVGEATTAVEAIALVASLRPDVVTLDLNIPDGGGQYALEQIMANTPTPMLVLSSTVHDGASVPAVEALVGGALLAVPKPPRWTPAFESELRRNVRTIRSVPVIRHIRGGVRNHASTADVGRRVITRSALPAMQYGELRVRVSSRSRPRPAVQLHWRRCSRDSRELTAPVLIVQHIHPDFVQGLVDWMARVSPLPVVLAQHGQRLRGGCVHIGPGGTHLRIGRDRRIELVDTPATFIARRPTNCSNQSRRAPARTASACC